MATISEPKTVQVHQNP